MIVYVCTGDPAPQETKEYVEALIRGGADIIELGLPFSDSVADGPVYTGGDRKGIKWGDEPGSIF